MIITGQHMTANPRVWKEANCLAENGYKVSVLTTVYDGDKLDEDNKLLSQLVVYKPMVNLIIGQGKFNDTVVSRIYRKLAFAAKKYLQYDSRLLIMYRPKKQVRRALLEKADLYIAHQEAGLIVGCELIKKGKRVAFDFEDWYSRDYLNNQRPIDLLKKYERFALNNGDFSYCPSLAMSIALRKTYGLVKGPEVIYNAFPGGKDVFSEKRSRRNSLVWFSQVVGPGRGLETLFEALKYLDQPVELHLLGKCQDTYKKFISKQVPEKHRLHFYDLIPHNEIVGFLNQFSIGLAIENTFPENKNITVSNKILQYLQSGLKVMATATEGQTEIASHFCNEAVLLVATQRPDHWANSIAYLLKGEEDRNEIQRKFNEHFSWELQATKLLRLVSGVFSEVRKAAANN